MSQENVEIARRALAAFESTGDRVGFLEVCAEDIVWDVSRSDFPADDLCLALELRIERGERRALSGRLVEIKPRRAFAR